MSLRNLSVFGLSALTLGLLASSASAQVVTTESTFGGTQTYTGVAGQVLENGPVNIGVAGDASAFAEAGTLWRNYLHGGAETSVIGQGSGLLTRPGSFAGSGVIDATAGASAWNPVASRFVDVGSSGSVETSGYFTGTPNAVGFTATQGTFSADAYRTFTFDPVSAATTAMSQTGLVLNGTGSAYLGSEITTQSSAWTVGD